MKVEGKIDTVFINAERTQLTVLLEGEHNIEPESKVELNIKNKVKRR